jgi:DNA-binding Lrp family transcriptional regulator
VVVEENPYHYTGLHAFGFLGGSQNSPRDVVDQMRQLGAPPEGPVVWAGTFVGDFSAMVHVRVEGEDLGALQDLIEGTFWGLGFRTTWAIEARSASTGAQFHGVKRGTQEIIAISALRVEPGSLDEVLEDVQDIDGFRGASVVYGRADVLVQFGGESFREVALAVERDLQKVDGIVHSSTAFCDGRR